MFQNKCNPAPVVANLCFLWRGAAPPPPRRRLLPQPVCRHRGGLQGVPGQLQQRHAVGGRVQAEGGAVERHRPRGEDLGVRCSLVCLCRFLSSSICRSVSVTAKPCALLLILLLLLLQARGQRHLAQLLPGDAGAADRSLPAAPADHPEAHRAEPPGVRAAGADGSHLHRPQLPHQRVQALPGSG